MFALGDLAVEIISGILATAISGASLLAWRRRRNRLPFAKVLNFAQNEKIVFVFPSRPDPPGYRGLLQDARVAFEDMLAVNYVQRALSLAGRLPEEYDMREHRRFRAHDAHDPAKNVVLICSPRSNPVTREFMEKVREGTKFDWSFRETSSGELEITTGTSGVWSSATYRQEPSIRAAQAQVEEGPLDDVAMIVKAPNPYNPAAKVLILAGIRGIGTWGAAKFLREHPEEIASRAGDASFAMLVKVKFRNWRIEAVEEVGVFRTF